MANPARGAIRLITNLTAQVATQIATAIAAAALPAANLTGTLPIGTFPVSVLSGAQDRSGAGAVNPTLARTTRLTASAVGQSVTLSANGSYPGQRHTIVAYSGYGTNTTVLTAGSASTAFVSATFSAKGHAIEMEWDGSAWFIASNAGTALA